MTLVLLGGCPAIEPISRLLIPQNRVVLGQRLCGIDIIIFFFQGTYPECLQEQVGFVAAQLQALGEISNEEQGDHMSISRPSREKRTEAPKDTHSQVLGQTTIRNEGCGKNWMVATAA